ncbi:hypothetical protein NMY22_g4485 [Coprinellus aureogranulatus]|nr:hypothetical protein NMY22_g4485 [Coprinellus aureogranulatus]
MALLRVPNEIISNLIHDHLYSPEEFAKTLSEEPYKGLAHRGVNRHANFTANLVLVNRQLHSVAIDELWRYVSIRTPASLEALARAVPIHGHRTRRLDLVLEESYRPHLIYEILKHMPKLLIIHMGNEVRSVLFHDPAPPIFAIAAICNKFPLLRRPQISRIEFEGSREVPAVVQLRELLNSNSQLISLRVSDVERPSFHIDWDTINPAVSAPHLQFLSVGFDYWIVPAAANDAVLGLESFVTMLCAHPVLDRLVSLQVWEFIPSIVQFLRVYGEGLRHLSIVLPEVDPHPSHVPELIHSCPRLTSVVWIVKNSGLLHRTRHVPSHHDTLRSAVIAYSKLDDETPPDYASGLRRMLRTILTGSYPSLQEVRVRLHGCGIPAIERDRWFGQFKTDFYERGISFDRD